MLSEEISYILGFIMADGHISSSSRNRGRISIEVSQKDQDIIYKIANALPCHYTIQSRTRDTNFKLNYSSTRLNIYNRDFREFVSQYIPSGKKSYISYIPKDVSKYDFLRGFIDGDGSIGITSRGVPFVSVVTVSNKFTEDFLRILESDFGIIKHLNPNKRDNAFNITLTREDAQDFIKRLYNNSSIFLARKYSQAQKCLRWERPLHCHRIHRKSWESWEDSFITQNSLQESIKKLNRTAQSIKCRLHRLKQNKEICNERF